jgi:sterol desaturase/sphingolipid hydroxylase (fatty acid hydroxylase superfamily)
MTAVAVNPNAPEAPSEANDLHSGPATLGAAFSYFLTRASPRIIITLALLSVGARIWLGGWAWRDLRIVAIIVAVWPFVEWLIHTFILHAKPSGPTKLIFNSKVAVKHRAHHLQPFHLPILFFPAHTFLTMVPGLTLLFWLTLPLPQAATAMATCMVMLLKYEWVHFLTHTRYVPKGRIYRTWWRNHRLHHCKNEHYWMGVSTTLADKVLGTFPAPNGVPTSPTCRTLGIDEETVRQA